MSSVSASTPKTSVDKIVDAFSAKSQYFPHKEELKGLFSTLRAALKNPQQSMDSQKLESRVWSYLNQMQAKGLTSNQRNHVLDAARIYAATSPNSPHIASVIKTVSEKVDKADQLVKDIESMIETVEGYQKERRTDLETHANGQVQERYEGHLEEINRLIRNDESLVSCLKKSLVVIRNEQTPKFIYDHVSELEHIIYICKSDIDTFEKELKCEIHEKQSDKDFDSRFDYPEKKGFLFCEDHFQLSTELPQVIDLLNRILHRKSEEQEVQAPANPTDESISEEVQSESDDLEVSDTESDSEVEEREGSTSQTDEAAVEVQQKRFFCCGKPTQVEEEETLQTGTDSEVAEQSVPQAEESVLSAEIEAQDAPESEEVTSQTAETPEEMPTRSRFSFCCRRPKEIVTSPEIAAENTITAEEDPAAESPLPEHPSGSPVEELDEKEPLSPLVEETPMEPEQVEETEAAAEEEAAPAPQASGSLMKWMAIPGVVGGIFFYLLNGYSSNTSN